MFQVLEHLCQDLCFPEIGTVGFVDQVAREMIRTDKEGFAMMLSDYHEHVAQLRVLSEKEQIRCTVNSEKLIEAVNSSKIHSPERK